MAEMLTFLNSESTNYIWETEGRVQYADENFAREVMQLFTTGLYSLGNDGRWLVDGDGNPIQTYTNDEITEFARLWTGFRQQPKRGNTEDWSKWKGNLLDPMMIDSLSRDSLPKVGLDCVPHSSIIGYENESLTSLPSDGLVQQLRWRRLSFVRRFADAAFSKERRDLPFIGITAKASSSQRPRQLGG